MINICNIFKMLKPIYNIIYILNFTYIINFTVFILFNLDSLNNKYTYFYNMRNSKLKTYINTILILCFAGLPPFLFFFFKIIIVIKAQNPTYLIILFLITNSFLLYYYTNFIVFQGTSTSNVLKFYKKNHSMYSSIFYTVIINTLIFTQIDYILYFIIIC